MKTSTFFSLMAEFGTAQIPIVEVGKKYFGHDERQAKSQASLCKYPFPVYRCGSQKGPWIVDAGALAEYLDERKEQARREWEKVNL